MRQRLVFLLTCADAVGGTERAILHQANWLSRRHDVEIISVFRTRSEPAFLPDPAVRVTYLVDLRMDRSGPSRIVEQAWEPVFTAQSDVELARELGSLRADVLITTSPALLCVAVTLAPHLKIVHQEHRVTELRGRRGIPLARFGEKAAAITFLSPKSLEWYASQPGPAAPHLEVITNSFDPRNRPRSDRRSNRIVWAGRLVEEKQPVHAIEAYAKVAIDHPEWTLDVYGEGPLLAEVRRAAVPGVNVAGASARMPQVWGEAAIALVTSRHESFALVLAEAMAAGVPPVSYDCPHGPREILQHGRTGLLVPPDDTEALASALRTLIEDDQLRDRLGLEGIDNVMKFDAELVMPQWERLYQRL